MGFDAHSAGFDTFEKIKCIFFIAPIGNLEKSRECFLTEKHSPDTLRGGTGRWPLASGVLSGVAEYTGRTEESPMLSVRCADVLQTSLGMSLVSTGCTGESPMLSVR